MDKKETEAPVEFEIPTEGSEGKEPEKVEKPQDNPEEGKKPDSAPLQEGKSKKEIAQDYGFEGSEEEQILSREEDETKVDYEKRYKDAQREYEKKYKPMEETLAFWDSVLAENPDLAERVAQVAQTKRQGMANPYNQNQELTERLSRIEKVLEGLTVHEKKKVLDERFTILKKFDETLGKGLKPEQKKEVSSYANALLNGKAVGSYEEALTKAYQLHNPQNLIEQGKSEAYLSQFQTSVSSFRQQSSDTPKTDESGEFEDLNPSALKFLEKAGTQYKKNAIARRMKK